MSLLIWNDSTDFNEITSLMYEFPCAAFCIFQLLSEAEFLFRLVESLGPPGGCGASWIAASRPVGLSAGAQGCTAKPNDTIWGSKLQARPVEQALSQPTSCSVSDE